MKRLIITGLNGSGKSYVAKLIAEARPDTPLVSYDAIRLEENWTKRSPHDIDVEVQRIVDSEAWIIEGGPSLLTLTVSRADCIMWLDPPEWLRMWRLTLRPLLNFGRTRLEIPPGNIEWPIHQYRFALRSFINRKKLRERISLRLLDNRCLLVWHCRLAREVDEAIRAFVNSG